MTWLFAAAELLIVDNSVDNGGRIYGGWRFTDGTGGGIGNGCVGGSRTLGWGHGCGWNDMRRWWRQGRAFSGNGKIITQLHNTRVLAKTVFSVRVIARRPKIAQSHNCTKLLIPPLRHGKGGAPCLSTATVCQNTMSSLVDMGQYFSAWRSCECCEVLICAFTSASSARTRDSKNQNFTCFTRESRWKVLTHYRRVMT